MRRRVGCHGLGARSLLGVGSLLVRLLVGARHHLAPPPSELLGHVSVGHIRILIFDCRAFGFGVVHVCIAPLGFVRIFLCLGGLGGGLGAGFVKASDNPTLSKPSKHGFRRIELLKDLDQIIVRLFTSGHHTSEGVDELLHFCHLDLGLGSRHLCLFQDNPLSRIQFFPSGTQGENDKEIDIRKKAQLPEEGVGLSWWRVQMK